MTVGLKEYKETDKLMFIIIQYFSGNESKDASNVNLKAVDTIGN